jgi:hypothetical protein
VNARPVYGVPDFPPINGKARHVASYDLIAHDRSLTKGEETAVYAIGVYQRRYRILQR